jgi:hypothetical protein
VAGGSERGGTHLHRVAADAGMHQMPVEITGEEVTAWRNRNKFHDGGGSRYAQSPPRIERDSLTACKSLGMVPATSGCVFRGCRGGCRARLADPILREGAGRPFIKPEKSIHVFMSTKYVDQLSEENKLGTLTF